MKLIPPYLAPAQGAFTSPPFLRRRLPHDRQHLQRPVHVCRHSGVPRLLVNIAVDTLNPSDNSDDDRLEMKQLQDMDGTPNRSPEGRTPFQSECLRAVVVVAHHWSGT